VATSALAWRQPQQIVLLVAFALGLVLVAGVGLVDDHRPLSARLRLAVHAVAGLVFALGAAGTFGDLKIALAAFVAVMVLTNVWNFMDGINGLAASQAVVVGSMLALAAGGTWALLGLALVAACLGFLPFNFPRARIFLGDVGSGALGFTLAALFTAALAAMPDSGVVLLIPLSAFLVDAGLTLARRVLRRERWWTAHTQHAYQQWAARLGSHTPVTLAYAGWTAVACLVAGVVVRTSDSGELYAVGWMTLAALTWAGLQRWAKPRGGLRTQIEKDKE
jgi:UDP-N-acetylmuramyl pentapeptide phosphotransferase/UDP-N-acetylglucosamine-1-phosphate transferase